MRNIKLLHFAPHTTASSSPHISPFAKVEKGCKRRLVEINKDVRFGGRIKTHPLSPSASAHVSPLI